MSGRRDRKKSVLFIIECCNNCSHLSVNSLSVFYAYASAYMSLFCTQYTAQNTQLKRSLGACDPPIV